MVKMSEYNPIWNNWDSYSDPEFLFNISVGALPIYDDYPVMRWNDYQSVQKWSTAPFVEKIFTTRMTELENAENERYWNDKARNMGFSLDDVSYPIRSGLYGRAVGPGDYFEATESVIGLYDDLKRW